MKVYELIQELANYEADSTIEFEVSTTRTFDVEAEFDRDNENDVQDVTVDIDLSGETFEYKSSREINRLKTVTISLE